MQKVIEESSKDHPKSYYILVMLFLKSVFVHRHKHT